MPSLTPTSLSPRNLKALHAITSAVFPSGETLHEPVDSDHLRRNLGLTLASMPRINRFGFLLIVWFFEWTCVLRYLKPFTRLPAHLQARWVEGWAESRFYAKRQAIRALATVVKVVHMSRSAVHQQVGYPGHTKGLTDRPPITLPAEGHFPQLTRDEEIRCQVVVVGSGAGGAVVAAELAEQGVDVVILEEGQFHGREEFRERTPADRLRETYRDGGGTIVLGRPPMPLPLGRTVGGSTTVNSGTCFRVPDRVLSQWEWQGLPVDRTALDRHYTKVEERISVVEVPDELLGGSSHVIARGAEALGYAHGPLLRNISGCERSAACVFGCPQDAKQSTNITYVPRALAAGARLYSGVRAQRILTADGRASGVFASSSRGGPALTVRADAVVSSCGTISGVPFLSTNGIRSKHLGRHLTLHPAAKIAARMPELVDGWKDTPQGYGIFELAEEGVLFEGAFLPPDFTSLALPFVGRALTKAMEDYRHLATFGLMVSDGPNGRVHTTPGGRPFCTYRISDEDLEKIRKGLHLLAQVFFAAGAERIYLPLAGDELQADEAAALRVLSRPLKAWNLELIAFHPLGTARMASNAKDGVVTPDLESWEIPGLFVVDGSVFPTSLGVNPQLTIMAYATRAAEILGARF